MRQEHDRPPADSPPGADSGKDHARGADITHLKDAQLRPLRRDMQMIFQDPYSSLNPRHTVGKIVGAPFRIQGVSPPGGVKKAVQDLLAAVGLNPEHYNRYPHEFSGGQRQRIGRPNPGAAPRLIVPTSRSRPWTSRFRHRSSTCWRICRRNST